MNHKNKFLFGISQGRLTASHELQRFPSEAWQQEFHNAPSIGISFIELLTERVFNKDNPVWSPEGRKEILDLCAQTGCEIYSLCIDYVIDNSLLGDDNQSTYQHVNDVFFAAEMLGCKAVIFPLLEKSELNEGNAETYASLFNEFSDIAKTHNLQIYIESMMKADELIHFFSLLDNDNIGAVFDTGNRAQECDDLYSEIVKMNGLIKHVHIKDKDKQGNNVILGTGLVNFKNIFEALNHINYTGRLNFETTRGANPINTASFHINLCNFFINEVTIED